MLPKVEGPSDVKKLKLQGGKTDILDMADHPTHHDNEDTVETTASNDSIVIGSAGSSLDMGYSSHDSSLHMDCISDLALAQGHRFTLQSQELEDCGAAALGDDTNEELDSIIFQFDTFFRTKLDAELTTLHENLHAILTEQQVHVRKIISSAGPQERVEVDTREVPAMPAFPDSKLNPFSGSASHGGVSPSLVEPFNTADTGDRSRCTCLYGNKRIQNGLVMELLSLSCDLTELLNQKKFKS